MVARANKVSLGTGQVWTMEDDIIFTLPDHNRTQHIESLRDAISESAAYWVVIRRNFAHMRSDQKDQDAGKQLKRKCTQTTSGSMSTAD